MGQSQNQTQPSNQTLTNSVNTLIHHISNKQQINQNSQFKTDPRYRFTRTTIPKIDKLSARNQTIKQFMGQLCKRVFEHAFAELIDEKLVKDQVKTYCSENIIYSTVQLIKQNALSEQDIKVINDCLKEDILPYMAQKYPLTDSQGGNTAFEREVIPQNNIDDDRFDLVTRSGVKFYLKQSGNYNSQIMRFLNNLIELSFSYQKSFEEDMDSLFTSIFVKQELNTIENIDVKKLRGEKKAIEKNNQYLKQQQSVSKKNDKRNQRYNQQNLQKQAYKHSPEQLKQMADYKQKVRSYTDYRIGKKIPSNIKPFSKKQISSGNLELDSPALSRILTKWCQQLEKCFDFDSIINREKPFKMMDGSFKFLHKKCWNNLLYLLLKREQKKIIEYKNQILGHSHIMQKKFAESDQKELKLYSNQQAVVGCFAIGIERINESYLIGYINKLIHGILSATQIYSNFIKIGMSDHNLQKIDENNLQNLISTVNISEDKEYKEHKHKSPNLVTFKVGDLLRCKCSSKQRQIIALYKKLEKISYQQPQKLMIVRVKNRLGKGTKDILINLFIENKYLAEVQLAITTGKSKFIKSSSYFRHYLYELQRAQFGPINQMCNIWTNEDGRSAIYRNFFEKKMLSRNLVSKKIQCEHQFNKVQLPNICDQCGYFFSPNKAEQTIQVCQKCNYNKCALCKYDDEAYDIKINSKIRQKIPEFPQNSSDANDRFNLIPKKGIIINKLVPNRKSTNFIKAQTSKNVQLLQQINKNKFQSIISFNKNIYPSKATPLFEAKQKYIKLMRFLTENILQEADSLDDYEEKSKLIKESFIIPHYLYESHISQKNSINLIKENITQKAFKNFFQRVKEQDKTQAPLNDKMKQGNTLDLPYLKKMNLSENNLKDFSDLVCYSQLEILILNNNQISEIPENKWRSLTILKLKSNKFTKFNANNLLYEESNSKQLMNQIQQIDLSQNQLESIDQKIQKFTHLRELNLSINNIIRLPQKFGYLQSLQILYITDNKIAQLPSSFVQLRNIQKLYMSNNKIKQLPQQLINFISLQQFDISFNALTKLPSSFQNLVSLRILNISSNQFTQVPEQVTKLQNLQQLYIISNNLTKLPQSIENLTSLTQLDISFNKINQLPTSIGELSCLQRLYINENRLTRLPQSFVQLCLEHLYLANNQITRLPQQFGQMVYLQQLDLSNNRITQLPQSFSQLMYLEQLNMSSNKITHLPQQFGQLQALNTLYIQKNQITALPQSFGKLQSLQTLDASQNRLTILPKSFGQLQSLQTLNLNKNKITKLPQQFVQLQSLFTFDIRNNQMISLPQQFGQLQSLHTLNLSRNKITKLPQSLGNLQSIHTLDLSQNKITQLPKSFKNLSTLSYLNLKKNNISEKCFSLLPQPISYVLEIDSNKNLKIEEFQANMQSQNFIVPQNL